MPTRRPADEYQDVTWVGSGQHGDVYKCIHLPSGRVLARKYINMHAAPDASSQLIRELSVLSRSEECPQVLHLEAAWVEFDRVSLIVEYCKHGSLKDWTNKNGSLKEGQLAFVAREIVKALIFMREKFKMHHRDLKPANILVHASGCIKVADFGEAGAMRHVGFGTLGFKSPESLDEGDESEAVNQEKADIWSLGLLLVEAATGFFPYESLSVIELWEAVKFEESPSLPAKGFSASARHFIDECLRKCPEKRAGLDYLLSHPFLTKLQVACMFESK